MESLSQDIAPAERRHGITVSASLLLLLINQMEAFFFFKSGMHIGGIEVEKASFYVCLFVQWSQWSYATMFEYDAAGS